MRRVVCQLTDNEKNEIEDLFEKKVALENLFKIIDPEKDERKYERLLSDYGKQCRLFNDWWQNMNATHSWGERNLYVDFSTSEIVEQHDENE